MKQLSKPLLSLSWQGSIDQVAILYKIYVRNLRMFVIRSIVCPRKAFLSSLVFAVGQEHNFGAPL
jgi:hypothetical protein